MDNLGRKRFAEKLRQAKEDGVALYLDGQPSTPEKIASRYVCESTNYMADYVLDRQGSLTELRYDRVTDYR